MDAYPSSAVPDPIAQGTAVAPHPALHAPAIHHQWECLSVERSHAPPGELAERVLSHHLVAVTLAGGGPSEKYLAGHGWRKVLSVPHRVTVIPARTAHAARWRYPSEYALIEIAPEFVSVVTGGELAVLEPSLAVEDGFVAHVAGALVEVAGSGTGGSLEAEGLGTALVAYLLRRAAVPSNRRRGDDLHGTQLERVVEFIAANLGAALSLHQLAEIAEMDVYRFVRAFKQSTGLPPHRFVLQARIEHAKALLRDRSLSISDVALRSGFATPSHFSTTFRRVTRVTPRAFRSAAR